MSNDEQFELKLMYLHFAKFEWYWHFAPRRADKGVYLYDVIIVWLQYCDQIFLFVFPAIIFSKAAYIFITFKNKSRLIYANQNEIKYVICKLIERYDAVFELKKIKLETRKHVNDSKCISLSIGEGSRRNNDLINKKAIKRELNLTDMLNVNWWKV